MYRPTVLAHLFLPLESDHIYTDYMDAHRSYIPERQGNAEMQNSSLPVFSIHDGLGFRTRLKPVRGSVML